jgi:methylthioxylose transferase
VATTSILRAGFSRALILPWRLRVRRPSLRDVGAAVSLAAATGLVMSAVELGYHAPASWNLQLGSAAPFLGTRRVATWGVIRSLWPAAAASMVMVVGLPLARRLRWRPLLASAWFAAAGWALLVASSDGWRSISATLVKPSEYRRVLPAVGNPLTFLSGFADNLHRYPTHVKGHPPLPVLVLWLLERVGLHGAGWSAALIIAVGTSSVVAVGLTVRAVAGIEVAQRVLPFVVLAPGTAWIATSMDGFFAGVVAWAIALTAIAWRRSRLVSIVGAALGAGVLTGCVPYLSYGLLPVGALIAAAFFIGRRAVAAAGGGLPRRETCWVAGGLVAGFALVAGLFTAAGFWWPDGIVATYHSYADTYGSGSRPYGYFLLADLAVFALMIGPATIAGLAKLRRGPVLLLVLAAVAAVVVSDLSGFMRGEVERIWLPYAPWVVIATATLTRRRGWLVLQIATAVAVQALVLSPW